MYFLPPPLLNGGGLVFLKKNIKGGKQLSKFCGRLVFLTHHFRVRNNGRSSVMTGQILGITCQIIVIHTLCPVIHFSHIHNSLLHYIIISVIIDDFFRDSFIL